MYWTVVVKQVQVGCLKVWFTSDCFQGTAPQPGFQDLLLCFFSFGLNVLICGSCDLVLGSLTNNDGDVYEKITWEVNFCYFKHYLAYSGLPVNRKLKIPWL